LWESSFGLLDVSFGFDRRSIISWKVAMRRGIRNEMGREWKGKDTWRGIWVGLEILRGFREGHTMRE